jgi:hypothetical protein
MWLAEYEALSNYDKGEFRRLGNYLLSHTYLSRYNYNPAEQMTKPNRDYQLVSRYFSILKDYFSLTGWLLEKDDNYGYISLINSYDHNRYRLTEFTTLFLYTCRLIYEENREQASSFHTVYSSTGEVVQKMDSLGLLKKDRATKTRRVEAQRSLAHYNIIEKMDTAPWETDGNKFLILPSILSMISNQGINDMTLELEELRLSDNVDEAESIEDVDEAEIAEDSIE